MDFERLLETNRTPHPNPPVIAPPPPRNIEAPLKSCVLVPVLLFTQY